MAFLSPKQSKIEESSLESMQGVYPDRASGYTIGGHPGNISGQDAIVSSGQHSTQVVHIRLVGSAAITPGCRHFTPGAPPFHPADAITSDCRHFHPDVSHLEFCCRHIPPGCFISGILTPDGRGERFNFPDQTYPDHLIALTWRVSRSTFWYIFLHSAAVFSWSFPIFPTDT